MNGIFTAFDPITGQVLFGGSAYDPSSMETQQCSILLDVDYRDGWINNGVHRAQPAQPTPHHVFNWVTKQWEDPRTLDDLRAAHWAHIKQARSQAEYAGFTWDGSVFDSDALSQNRITGAVLLAQIALGMGVPFTKDWILADNTVRTLDATEMLQVGLALGMHVAAQFSKGQELREQIALASVEQLQSIAWDSLN